jgi:signal transduction histidine kinase
VIARLRHPRTTVRWRLTLMYGGLFLISGIALLAITYTLVSHATINGPFIDPARFLFTGPPRIGQVPPSGGSVSLRAGGHHNFQRVTPPRAIQALIKSRAGRAAVVSVGSGQRISDLHQLVIESSIALAIMSVISAALGWVVAGRVLQPLRQMTVTTQQISEANLSQRLAMAGPRDELRELSDTIDGLLERLGAAFEAQRQFVANASHELRTPLTTARALLEMIITDPHATVDSFRATCEQVLEEEAQQEQLIEAMLALAQGQRGIDRREAVELATLTSEVLQAH